MFGKFSSSTSSLKLRIVSYNVLSSHLATEISYPTLNPEHLKAENRLRFVIEKIEREIDNANNNAINDGRIVICLQEVSQDWEGALHVLFAKKGFHLISGRYGKPFNGYMGVALAWPSNAFDVEDVNIVRLAEQREEGWPKNPERNLWENFVTNLQTFVGGFWSPNKDQDTPPDHWDLSKNRFNSLITASLKDKRSGIVFTVGTYHMPCAYYCPMAMTIHADLASRHIERMAEKQQSRQQQQQQQENENASGKVTAVPFILAGDFNIKPTEPVYKLLTTGEIDHDGPFFPTPKEGMEWQPTTKQPLQSAYATNGRTEPDFTNYARLGEGEPFIDTLDYIFLSHQWNVTSVLEIPHRDQAMGPFPNLDVNEPSDHVMIAADIDLLP